MHTLFVINYSRFRYKGQHPQVYTSYFVQLKKCPLVLVFFSPEGHRYPMASFLTIKGCMSENEWREPWQRAHTLMRKPCHCVSFIFSVHLSYSYAQLLMTHIWRCGCDASFAFKDKSFKAWLQKCSLPGLKILNWRDIQSVTPFHDQKPSEESPQGREMPDKEHVDRGQTKPSQADRHPSRKVCLCYCWQAKC